jgi:hypothetical protein
MDDFSDLHDPVERLIFRSEVDSPKVAIEIRVEADCLIVLEGVLVIQGRFSQYSNG